MKLSTSLLLLPAASVLVVAAIGSGACSSSVTVTIPPTEPIPSGTSFPDNLSTGDSCNGNYFIEAATGSGYLICDNGSWEYTVDDPTNDGFTSDESIEGSDDSSDDAASSDDMSDDSTSSDESTGSEDMSDDSTSSEDGDSSS